MNTNPFGHSGPPSTQFLAYDADGFMNTKLFKILKRHKKLNVLQLALKMASLIVGILCRFKSLIIFQNYIFYSMNSFL